jgi:L-lactate dehydrogenase
VLSVSSLIQDYLGIRDVCLSLPTVVNRAGVERVLNVELEEHELESLRRSAEVLKSTIARLEPAG